jgi:2-keto-4-pentenoate hydratase/2-oxohepta-3-ene-1,7-dioic acid hydratase in catechol pathway
MKVCRYSLKSIFFREPRLGILLEDHTLIDPNLCFALEYQREGHYNPRERADYMMPGSLYQLLRTCPHPIDRLHQALEYFTFFHKMGLNDLKDGSPISFDLDMDHDLKFEAPLDQIGTYRDFYAHEKHVKTGFEKRKEEIPPAWYEMPVYYKGGTNSFIGPDDEILWPAYTDILDYELEIGAVIGRDGFNIKEKDALSHIFGLTILNDISARDIQKKEMAVRLGPAKGKDFCSIIGPVITTMDEFNGKEPDLLMTAKINGEEWSRGQSGDSHFNFAQMITHVAQDEWLLAGDLLGSGTVGTGCGLELDKWIKPGDKIELYIDKIGHLINTVGEKTKR